MLLFQKATTIQRCSKNQHLSNKASAELIRDNGSKRLKHILLAHLSESHNEPKIAIETHEKMAADFYKKYKTELSVAPIGKNDDEIEVLVVKPQI